MPDVVSGAYLDTSYIIRYLTNDPIHMAKVAAKVIDSEQALILSEGILLESAYVLQSVYQVPRAAIVDSLSLLVQRKNLHMAKLSKGAVLEALRLCRDSGRVSFVDAMLWAEALEAGSARVYTFDKRFPSQGIAIMD